MLKVLTLRFAYQNSARCASVLSFKLSDTISSPFRLQTVETRVPCRGIRGAKSRVLHRDVIDKYKLQKIQEIEQSFPNAAHRASVGMPTIISDPDMPVQDLENPYEKPKKRCILCVHNVDLDYKNARLLSQFVSPHTGQIYGRHITGLCLFMQKRISKLIKRSQFFGFMPYVHKDPRFLRDPKLFDPFQRKS